MSDTIEGRLGRAPVVPLVQADRPETAVRITEALLQGGLSVIEVVLRTEQALECLAAVSEAFPEAIVGAGTVLSRQQSVASVRAGASFIVSPGLDEGVVAIATAEGLPVFPGVATATEAQRAWNLNLRSVKFFPAGNAGGCGMLKALSSVFEGMSFMPTGGVTPGNLAEYLALPAVLACGGSWLTPPQAVADGDFKRISTLAEEALEIARKARRGWLAET